MDFQSVIDNRKMVRSFSTRPIEEEKLQQIINNIFEGPSAGYSQGTQIIVLTEEDSREKFYQQWGSLDERASYKKKWPDLENAPVIILMCSDEKRYRERYQEADKNGLNNDTMPWWYIDAGMATLLGLLSAVDQELVACFTGIKSQKYMREAFNIPNYIEVIGAISIGYSNGKYRPSQSARRLKRPYNEIVHNNSW